MPKTVTTTKPAAKVTAKITPRKTAAKAEAAAPAVVGAKAPRRAVTAKAGTKAAPGSIKLFVLLTSARPVSGPRLWSHTQAALEVLGMTTGKPVMRESVALVIGGRAIGYHVTNGNMADKGERVHLTESGIRNFAARTEHKAYEREMTDAFRAMLLKGTASQTYSIHKTNLKSVELPL